MNGSNANNRTNSFLNQMNDQFFQPRGLFCMVMKYNSQEGASHETVDTSSTIMKSLTTSDSRTKEQMKRFQAASGTTRGEIEMPEAAPLIFPELDRVEEIDENGKPRGGLKKTGQVIANYFDKRAQAKFVRTKMRFLIHSSLMNVTGCREPRLDPCLSVTTRAQIRIALRRPESSCQQWLPDLVGNGRLRRLQGQFQRPKGWPQR